MKKMIRYCGFLPGGFFALLFVFMAFIGGMDYLSQIPIIMYINVTCLFIAPFFLGHKNHRLVGYIAVTVSVVCFIYQAIMNYSHMLLYIGVAVALVIYFVAYAYFLEKTDDF